MSEQNKAILRRFYEEMFNTGDVSLADEIIALDYVNHNPVPGELPGREGLKAFITLVRTAFADLHYRIEDLIAEGDKVVTRCTITGTHQAEFAGVAASGKSINLTVITIHRVTNGQIQEGWVEADYLNLMQQLGAIPSGE